MGLGIRGWGLGVEGFEDFQCFRKDIVCIEKCYSIIRFLLFLFITLPETNRKVWVKTIAKLQKKRPENPGL
jgi:hypothetical protein